jgi:3-hydroxyisobutyrate dehydrogenase-like beta-hydroxyacid dehydrogenase
MIKDFDIIIDTARNDHVPMFVAALIRQQYEAAQVEGNAGRDFFVLCEAGRRH